MVSFGFAGQGRAIMRGPMVSGVINQLLTTTEWYAISKHNLISREDGNFPIIAKQAWLLCNFFVLFCI